MDLDLAINNGLVIDGTGNPRYRASIGIMDGKIAGITPSEIRDAKQMIEAAGLAVCPGFVDIHSHSDFALLAESDAQSKIRQGVTTEVVGNCGVSATPLEGEAIHDAETSAKQCGLRVTWSSLGEYLSRLERQGVVLNVACLVGNGTIRASVMGFENRAPSAREMRRMQKLLAQCMREGAFGLSSGLLYPPSCYAKLDELSRLAQTAASFGGIYTTHIRDESDGLEEAVNEALAVGRRAGVAVQISHHKACGKRNWGKVKRTLENIAEARAKGIDAAVDVYPYTAYSTWLSAAIPPWACEGGDQRLIERLNDRTVRAKLKRQMRGGLPKWESMTKGASWDRFTISSFPQKPSLVGKTIQQISRSRKCDPFEVVFDLLVEGEAAVEVVVEDMSERDVRLVLQSRLSMIGSDGESLSTKGRLGKGRPHPRSFGTFPRVLGRYVRQNHLLTLEGAIRKMTFLPANRIGLTDRGVIRKGMAADLVIFDPARVADTATYLKPKAFPVGIEYVIVNGITTVARGKFLGRLNGHALRHDAPGL
ncbi:MAG: D-aminoacylase [Candidatus Bathyarchaeia archaeon]